MAIGTIGQRLAEIRGTRRLSQQEVADLIGMHVQNVCRMEKARTMHVRSDTLVKLCQTLAVSADYLLGLSDDPRPRRTRSTKERTCTDPL